jgi:hypothetical protein
MTNNNSIQTKADNFAYITFKMQASMHATDARFYGTEHTVHRICSCVLACAAGNMELLKSAKLGIVDGFNRLKNEENLPILSYDTISVILKKIDSDSKTVGYGKSYTQTLKGLDSSQGFKAMP